MDKIQFLTGGGTRECDRPSCEGTYVPVPDTVHVDEGDGSAMVDLRCDRACGMSSVHYWVASDEEYEAVFGHRFGEDPDEEGPEVSAADSAEDGADNAAEGSGRGPGSGNDPGRAAAAVAEAAESVRRLSAGRVSAREVADLVARLRGLTDTDADPVVRAGFLADKRALIERIEADHTRNDDADGSGVSR